MVTDSASSKSKFALRNVHLAHSLEDLGHAVVGVRPLELKVKVSASEVRVANLASRNGEISFGIVISVMRKINILLRLGLLPVIPERVTILHHVFEEHVEHLACFVRFGSDARAAGCLGAVLVQ